MSASDATMKTMTADAAAALSAPAASTPQRLTESGSEVALKALTGKVVASTQALTAYAEQKIDDPSIQAYLVRLQTLSKAQAQIEEAREMGSEFLQGVVASDIKQKEQEYHDYEKSISSYAQLADWEVEKKQKLHEVVVKSKQTRLEFFKQLRQLSVNSLVVTRNTHTVCAAALTLVRAQIEQNILKFRQALQAYVDNSKPGPKQKRRISKTTEWIQCLVEVQKEFDAIKESAAKLLDFLGQKIQSATHEAEQFSRQSVDLRINDEGFAATFTEKDRNRQLYFDWESQLDIINAVMILGEIINPTHAVDRMGVIAAGSSSSAATDDLDFDAITTRPHSGSGSSSRVSPAKSAAGDLLSMTDTQQDNTRKKQKSRPLRKHASIAQMDELIQFKSLDTVILGPEHDGYTTWMMLRNALIAQVAASNMHLEKLVQYQKDLGMLKDTWRARATQHDQEILDLSEEIQDLEAQIQAMQEKAGLEDQFNKRILDNSNEDLQIKINEYHQFLEKISKEKEGVLTTLIRNLSNPREAMRPIRDAILHLQPIPARIDEAKKSIKADREREIRKMTAMLADQEHFEETSKVVLPYRRSELERKRKLQHWFLSEPMGDLLELIGLIDTEIANFSLSKAERIRLRALHAPTPPGSTPGSPRTPVGAAAFSAGGILRSLSGPNGHGSTTTRRASLGDTKEDVTAITRLRLPNGVDHSEPSTPDSSAVTSPLRSRAWMSALSPGRSDGPSAVAVTRSSSGAVAGRAQVKSRSPKKSNIQELTDESNKGFLDESSIIAYLRIMRNVVNDQVWIKAEELAKNRFFKKEVRQADADAIRDFNELLNAIGEIDNPRGDSSLKLFHHCYDIVMQHAFTELGQNKVFYEQLKQLMRIAYEKTNDPLKRDLTNAGITQSIIQDDEKNPPEVLKSLENLEKAVQNEIRNQAILYNQKRIFTKLLSEADFQAIKDFRELQQVLAKLKQARTNVLQIFPECFSVLVNQAAATAKVDNREFYNRQKGLMRQAYDGMTDELRRKLNLNQMAAWIRIDDDNIANARRAQSAAGANYTRYTQ